MKITIEPTDEIILTPDGPVRMWKGHTDKGTPIIAGVMCVGCAADDERANAELDAVLLVMVDKP